MRILVYGLNFFPEVTGVGRYTGEMAAWLAAAGHEVRVVTAPPHFPDWVVGKGYSGAGYRRENWKGVEIWRAPIWVLGRRGGSSRLLSLFSFAISSIPEVLRQVTWRPEVVWIAQPTLACAPVGIVAALLSGARSWMHVQDFEVDAAFELGVLPGRFQRNLASWLERKVLSCFDRVSTISPNMRARLSLKGVPQERTVYFPNWVDTDEIHPLVGPSPYRRELSIPDDAIVVLYSGSIGAKQGIGILGDAARLLAGEASICFVFCGQGVGRVELEARCRGLSNVQLLPLQPAERLNELLNLADIHVLPQRRSAADLVLPSKLLGMLASGRPVIATAENRSALGDIVERFGLLVPPEDPQHLAQAIMRLAGSASLRRQMGDMGRRHAQQHLDRGAVLGRFERELRVLAAGLIGERPA